MSDAMTIDKIERSKPTNHIIMFIDALWMQILLYCLSSNVPQMAAFLLSMFAQVGCWK